MQNFRALGAPPPDPRASDGWGLCPQAPSLWRLEASPPDPHWPLAAGGSAPRPPKQPHHYEFLATRLLTVKPALEKHLSEEADAGMQRLLQIGKSKICGPPFHVSILKG